MKKIDKVYALKVYDKTNKLIPNIMLFKTYKSAKKTAAELVPVDYSFEITLCEISN